MRSWLASLVLLLAAASLAPAQKAEPGPKPTEDRPKPMDPPGKDPTTPSPDLKKALDPVKTQSGVASKLPALALKGRVILKGQPPAALLEIDGKGPLLLVGRDQSFNAGGSSFKVLEVNVSEVRLRGGPYDEIIVLR